MVEYYGHNRTPRRLSMSERILLFFSFGFRAQTAYIFIEFWRTEGWWLLKALELVKSDSVYFSFEDGHTYWCFATSEKSSYCTTVLLLLSLLSRLYPLSYVINQLYSTYSWPIYLLIPAYCWYLVLNVSSHFDWDHGFRLFLLTPRLRRLLTNAEEYGFNKGAKWYSAR